MNELQLAGFGYKQSLGPIHPVLAMSSLGHWKPGVGLGVVVVGGRGRGVVVVVVVGGRGRGVVVVVVVGGRGRGVVVVVVVGGRGRGVVVVILPGQVELCGQSHIFSLSFHSRPAGQGIT
jgi:hypothetical protein